MSDVHQWRRMLPPMNRPRTPQIVVESNDEPSHDRKEDRLAKMDRVSTLTTVSSTASMPDVLASEPKRHSRPKLFTRASQYFGGKSHSNPRFSQNYFADVQPPENLHSASINSIISSITTSITNNFAKPLSVQNNSPILRVFESYRLLSEEKDELEEKLTEAVTHNNTTLDTLEGERRRWKEDELNYKAEIKRLEVIIACGKTGLAEVALARQTSLIRRELKTKARQKEEYNDISHDTGGTDARKVIRPLSPSHSMSVLSRALTVGQEPASPKLPPATLPSKTSGLRLSRVLTPRRWTNISKTARWARSLSPTKSTKSLKLTKSGSVPSEILDDDFCSVDGDLLPDEIDQQQLTMQGIEHVRKLIANARRTSVTETMEWLERCMVGYAEHTSSDGPPSSTTSSYPESAPDFCRPTEHTKMRENLAMRRGGEEIQIETHNEEPLRPFSFFAGDDRDMVTSVPLQTISVYTADFSPVFPTRSPSMIPSPVLDHLLARPRREDSGSSLITSFQRSPRSESVFPRTPSGASSHMSAVSAVRQNLGGFGLVEGSNSARNKSGSRDADEKSPSPYDRNE